MIPVVIYGADRLSAKQKFDQFCEDLKSKGFKIKKIDGDTLKDTQSIFNELKTSPLFAEKTAIAILYLGQNPNIKLQKDILKMAKSANKPVVFFETEENGEVISFAERAPWKLIRFEKPEKRLIPEWIVNTAKSFGISISIGWAKQIADTLDYRQEIIYQALNKVSLMTDLVDQKTWPIVKKIVWSEHEKKIWKLVDALMMGKSTEVKRLLPHTLDNRSTMQILHTIYSRYRKLLVFQSYVKQGISVSEAARRAMVQQFTISRFLYASRRTTLKKNVEILKKTVETESKIKAGEIQPYTGLIEIVALIARPISRKV